MKLLWIVVGILALLWLGFLTIDRNSVQLHLNNHDKQFGEVDNRFNSLDETYQTKDGFLSEDNSIDKTEDKADQTEDKADQKVEMPYEKEKTNENTNLRKDDNAMPKADNENELDLKPNLNFDNPMDEDKDKKFNKNQDVSFNNDESIVAFGYVNDHLFRGNKSVEAFELNQIEDEVITAFKVR